MAGGSDSILKTVGGKAADEQRFIGSDEDG